MGRRSRRRGAAVPIVPAERAAPAPAPRRPPPGARPRPPWHPVPLVELCVLVGLVLLVLGALDLGSDRGRLLLLFGLALGSLGGLDTALREHLGGYRSHTTVLAALPAVVTAAALSIAGVPWPALAAALAMFAGAFWLLRRAFAHRARRAGRAY